MQNEREHREVPGKIYLIAATPPSWLVISSSLFYTLLAIGKNLLLPEYFGLQNLRSNYFFKL